MAALSDQLQGFRCSYRALAELFRQRDDQELTIRRPHWDGDKLYVLELDEHQGPAEAAEAALVYWSGKVTGEPPLFAADMGCLHLFALCGWRGVVLPAPYVPPPHTPHRAAPSPKAAAGSRRFLILAKKSGESMDPDAFASACASTNLDGSPALGGSA